MKKYSAITLVVLLLFTSVIMFPQPFVTEAKTTKELDAERLTKCNKDYAGKFDVPPGYPYCSENGYPFQQRLWDDLGFISYGDKDSQVGLLALNRGTNNFKAGYSDPFEDIDYPNRNKYSDHVDAIHQGERAGIGHPYFTQDNKVYGEYRYLGYNKAGEPYLNPYFIADQRVGSTDNFVWIYHPWAYPKSFSTKPSSVSPFLTEEYKKRPEDDPIEEIYGRKKVDEVNSIIQSLYVNINKSTNPNDKSRNLFDYMYITQEPSVWAEGSGTLWHDAGQYGIWYASYAINKRKNKANTPVKSLITTEVDSNYDLAKAINDPFTLTYRLSGELLDDDYYNDRYKRAVYYTRHDVSKWALKVEVQHQNEPWKPIGTFEDNVIKKDRGMAYRDLDIAIPKSNYANGGTMNIRLTSTVTYADGNTAQGISIYSQGFGVTPEFTVVLTPPPPPELDLSDIVCSPTVGRDAIDILPFKDLFDNTDTSGLNVTLWVNGNVVDYNHFFSGNYVFGDDADGENHVLLLYEAEPVFDYRIPDVPLFRSPCYSSSWVKVHDSKPGAAFELDGGTWKENRTMTITNTSTSSVKTDSYVLARYPITNYTWTFETLEGDGERIMGTDTDLFKELMYTKPGQYQITLTSKNALGRVSDPYVLDFSVVEDTPPAMIYFAINSQVGRGEAVQFHHDIISIDGDHIIDEVNEIYFDENNDETYSQLVETINGPLYNYAPVHGLGKYKVVTTAHESFGQDTLYDVIPEEAKRSSSTTTYFKVDNYIPYSDIYTDIPYEQMDAEIYFMLDKNMEQSKIDYVKGNTVTITNEFRKQAIDAKVNTWDMKTYTYNQFVDVSWYTGGTRPSNTYNYTAPNGYSGVLDKYNQSDNGYYHDFGRYISVVDVPGHYKPETTYIPWCYMKEEGGQGREWSHAPPCDFASNETTIPVQTQVWVDTTYKNVWDPDVQWVSSWTGYYRGYVYKDIRQVYTTPWKKPESHKYIVYVSDNFVNDTNDLTMVKAKTDAKLILVGSAGIRSQSSHDYFIENVGQSIEEVVKQVVDEVKRDSPPSTQMIVLVGESFNLLTVDADPEGDPITVKEMQFVHDEHYFDNPQGLASFAFPLYDESQYGPELLSNSFSFNKAGKYTIYRRTMDEPEGYPEYAYYSNEAEITIIAHRKPIALATLDWDYNPTKNVYITNWVDKSYDLDHQYSRPDKGIVERKIRYRIKSSDEWYYKIPDELQAGTYVLEYVVKDVEGAWSDPFKLEFTLSNVAPIQLLDAKMKNDDPYFNRSDGKVEIPAGEKVQLYDIHTRYPYNLELSIDLLKNGAVVSGTNKKVQYTTSTATKAGNDIFWNPIKFDIPLNNIVQDTAKGNAYKVRLTARALTGGGASAVKEFDLKVDTPVNLIVIDHPEEMVVNDLLYDFKADTSKYVDSVQMILFKGTSYQRTVNLSGSTDGRIKHWNYLQYSVPNVPEGYYNFEYIAKTPNLNQETITKRSYVQQAFIRPSVHHTDAWNEHRIAYNIKESGNPNSPRGYNVFWKGERFILFAETSTASRVDVTLLETGDMVILSGNQSRTIWNGEMWDSSYESTLENGYYTFRFKGYYNNGVSRVEDVVIEIRDKFVTGVHRVK